MRAIWSGSLSFGLVNIPVRLYSASRERPLSFKLLDKKDHAPVGYKKIRRTDEKEVAQKDIVKGFEVEKGEFVILEPEDFRNASPKKTQTIEIVQFADAGDIDIAQKNPNNRNRAVCRRGRYRPDVLRAALLYRA